jgi:hypothetical protein
VALPAGIANFPIIGCSSVFPDGKWRLYEFGDEFRSPELTELLHTISEIRKMNPLGVETFHD